MTSYGPVSAMLISFVLSQLLTSLCRGVPLQLQPHRQPETVSQHPGCVHGNRTYAPGERYRMNACTTCHCPRHVTSHSRPHCTVQDCQPTNNCFRFVDRKLETDCCPVCAEFGCLHNGTVFAAGQIVLETRCELCRCSPDGGPVVCSLKPSSCSASELHTSTSNCVDHAFDDETCCRYCPNGNNCWLNDQIIPFGDVIDVGGCRKCTCPPADHAVPFWRRERGHHAICSVDKKCQEERIADSE